MKSRKGKIFNTGRTHFKKGAAPWNKGLTKNNSEKIKSYYSDCRLGENNPNYKTQGRKQRITAEGYICVFLPNHPYANSNGYVAEHRLVMEAHLGRILLPTEVIHHINGITSDNRIENLMLFSCSGDHIKWHRKHK